MSILSDFEDRVGGALEGMFAGVFRSPVQPVEIARALGKAMDDGRSVGVGRVYAPATYTVALSEEDADKFGGFLTTLSGELSTFLVDHAREQHYRIVGKPFVEFVIHEDLRLGRFRVSAELEQVEEEEPEAAERPAPAADASERGRPEPSAPAGPPGPASVSVGDAGPRVELRGDRVRVGRLNDCDICLADANASRRHAEFVSDGEGWAVADLGSSNGTFVNGERITRAGLRDGDIVEIGLTQLTFHQRGR